MKESEALWFIMRWYVQTVRPWRIFYSVSVCYEFTFNSPCFAHLIKTSHEWQVTILNPRTVGKAVEKKRTTHSSISPTTTTAFALEQGTYQLQLLQHNTDVLHAWAHWMLVALMLLQFADIIMCYMRMCCQQWPISFKPIEKLAWKLLSNFILAILVWLQLNSSNLSVNHSVIQLQLPPSSSFSFLVNISALVWLISRSHVNPVFNRSVCLLGEYEGGFCAPSRFPWHAPHDRLLMPTYLNNCTCRNIPVNLCPIIDARISDFWLR